MSKVGVSRRDFLRMSGIAGVGLAMAACTPTAAPEGGAADEGDSGTAVEPTTLTMWGWWDLRMAIYEQAATSFTEQNPDVQIVVETLPGGELQQRVYSAVAAGTGPNMLKMAEFYFPMRDQGLLLEFPEDIFPDQWFEEMYPTVDWDAYGHYVAPSAGCGTVLIYNKRMFEEAGLDPEAPPQTWAELVEAAKAVTIMEGNTMRQAGFIPSSEWPGLSQIYQLGGDIIVTEDGRRLANFESEEVQAGIKAITDLATVHGVWDPTFPNAVESVGTGLAAMTEDQAWVIGEFAGTYTDIFPELGFAPNPTPTGEPDPYYGYKSTVLALSALDGHPDQAGDTFRFFEHLYKDAGAEIFWQLAELLSCAPVRADLVDDPRLQENEAMRTVVEVLPFEKDPVNPPAQMIDLWSDMIGLVVIEGQSVEAATEVMDQAMQEILDQSDTAG